MVINREDGRTPTMLRPLTCCRSILNRAHGSASWSQGDTKVLAAVYGPKAGTKKNVNPEKASIEVIWKPKTDVVLDPTKLEEQKMKAFVYMVFPNSILSVLKNSSHASDEPVEQGVIASVTHGTMSVEDYVNCLKIGQAATAKLSNFLRTRLQNQLPSDLLGET